MRIVVLDGYAENPGDLSWDWMKNIGEYVIYDRTPAELIFERAKGFDVVITNKTPLKRNVLEKLNELKYIGLLSTGFNVVDWEYCKERNIPVCNIPTYSTEAVAQCTFAHIINFTNSVALHSNSVHNGEWAKNPDFCYWLSPLMELKGKTLGIIGFGKIGKAVADIALAFGMNVMALTNHPAPYKNVEFTDKDNLLASSDFVSLHCPLTPATEGMVNEEFLGKMKRTAMLINTSRGPVIDENALAKALENGVIAAAGLDVMCKEPPEADNPLTKLQNCSITPHIAWAGFETRARLMDIAKENLERFIDGKVQNCVY